MNTEIKFELLPLREYPSVIAKYAADLDEFKREAENIQTVIKRFETIAKGSVTGPNAEQRAKAYQEKLDESKNYQALLAQLEEADVRRVRTEIQLQRLRDEFTVLKLEARLEIARAGVEA